MIRSNKKKNAITGNPNIAKIIARAPAFHSERKKILSSWLLFIEASCDFTIATQSFSCSRKYEPERWHEKINNKIAKSLA